MPKYDVSLRWITTEVACATITVDAENESQARVAAHDLVYEQGLDVRWGRPEIIDGEYHIDDATLVEGEE